MFHKLYILEQTKHLVDIALALFLFYSFYCQTILRRNVLGSKLVYIMYLLYIREQYS